MKKRALLVAINYTGTDYALRGCVNDSKHMKAMLESKGFTEIEQILEKNATTENILAGLNRLVKGIEPGDTIVFHYSGHGSQVYSSLETDKLDEIICPVDLDWQKNVITDDELKSIFNPLPNGVNTIVVLDCCHSGTALDQTTSASITLPVVEGVSKVKVVKKSMKSRYLAPPTTVLNKIKKKKLVLREWSTSRDINSGALLIAGCKESQTSADATIGGIPQGAATAALLIACNTNPDISYQDLINKMNGFMAVNGFTQTPELSGSADLYERSFLESADVPAEEADVPAEEADVPAEENVGNIAEDIFADDDIVGTYTSMNEVFTVPSMTDLADIGLTKKDVLLFGAVVVVLLLVLIIGLS